MASIKVYIERNTVIAINKTKTNNSGILPVIVYLKYGVKQKSRLPKNIVVLPDVKQNSIFIAVNNTILDCIIEKVIFMSFLLFIIIILK